MEKQDVDKLMEEESFKELMEEAKSTMRTTKFVSETCLLNDIIIYFYKQNKFPEFFEELNEVRARIKGELMNTPVDELFN